MKIRHRLTLLFALATAGVLGLVFLFIYWFTWDFHRKEFSERLRLRADLTEKFYLEESRLPANLARQVQEQFLLKLPQEREWLLDPEAPVPDSLAPVLRKATDRLQSGEDLYFRDEDRQGIARFYTLDSRRHLIIVTAVDEFGDTKLTHLRKILLFSLPLGLLLVGLTGWLSTRRALKPLETNILRARAITASKLGTRLTLPPHKDEIHDFVAMFNDLLDRLQQAFDFQRTFISNASHEIRNPLAVISGEAEIALSANRDPEAYRQSLETISREADRLHHLVNSLLSLARSGGEGDMPDREVLTVSDILSDLREYLTSLPGRAPIRWPTEPLPEGSFLGNRLLIRSALQNLLDNALKYDPKGNVAVTAEQDAESVRIRVTDHGIGIPPEEIDQITEPLFRASNSRDFPGQGLGLALVDRIIRWHSGRLSVDSTVARGTTMTLSLPRQS